MHKYSIPVMFFLVIFIFVNSQIFSQPNKNTSSEKAKIVVSGNFILATDFKSVYTSYGGPSVKFTFSKNVYACISMFPSLRWKNESNKPDVLPILGTGIYIGYKSLIVAIPLYYISNENKWKAAFGVGVKF